MSSPVAIAVHGGAGTLARRKREYPGRKKYEQALAESLRAGQSVLLKGGSAVRAVVAAVRVLEDNPLFNAGRGAALCADGTVELSASVMCGRTLDAGAMARLTRIRNPVAGAHTLLRHHHGLLSGAAADAFAEAAGADTAATDYFIIEERLRQWKKRQHSSEAVLDHSDEQDDHGTVGAVARDRRGNLAAATSTGGLVNQLPGRIGDSPVTGAGTWAANAVCALSATGKGDIFLRHGFARRVADLIELAGLTLHEAATAALKEIHLLHGTGGCILVDALGNIEMPFTSAQMLRGCCAGRGNPVVGIAPGESVEIT